MPTANYKLAAGFCQVFGLTQFANAEANCFPKFNFCFDIKHRLGAALSNVNVNRSVIIAVKEKTKAVLNEYSWHKCIRSCSRERHETPPIVNL